MSIAVATTPTTRFAAGAAFIEDGYVPISEAKISILDWVSSAPTSPMTWCMCGKAGSSA